jgi:hypothetical protein
MSCNCMAQSGGWSTKLMGSDTYTRRDPLHICGLQLDVRDKSATIFSTEQLMPVWMEHGRGWAGLGVPVYQGS